MPIAIDTFSVAPPPTTDCLSVPITANVLHVVNGEHYAGAERVQDLLAARLPELGFAVGIACVKPDLFPALRRTREVPLYATPMRSRFDVGAVRQVADIIRRVGYDLVHTHTPRSALVGRAAAVLAGVPVVHHIHSPTSQDSTRAMTNRVNALVERASLLGISGVIAVSQAMGRYGRSLGLPRRLVHVVPNGVPQRGDLPPRDRPRDPWTLGTVALFRPRKGLEVLIETIAILRDLGRSVRLRAVGGFETPEYEQEIHDVVERHRVADRIDWVGFAQDVNAELDKIDLFVLPSLFGEGLPMVILEAMAAGVPVVATRVEGVPEAIRDAREGVLAGPGSPHELAMAVERVITGEVDWTRLRAGAHRRHAQQFSDRAMAAGVAEVYHQVLGR